MTQTACLTLSLLPRVVFLGVCLPCVALTAESFSILSPLECDILKGGTDYSIQWKSESEVQSLNIAYLRDPRSERQLIANSLSGVGGSVTWKVPRDMTITGSLIFEYTERGESKTVRCNNLSVDSIRPKTKIEEPASTPSMSVPLVIEIRDAGPAKLRSAKLWYSSDDGASWKEDVKLDIKPGEPAWNSPVPEGYLWKAPSPGDYLLCVVAEDLAGNAMPEPKGKMGTRCLVLASP